MRRILKRNHGLIDERPNKNELKYKIVSNFTSTLMFMTSNIISATIIIDLQVEFTSSNIIIIAIIMI